jgi:hypothetical protein
MARRSIWTRAKPYVGLERPHFWTPFRGQSDAWGRSSPPGDSFRCFARACRRILRRNMCRKRVTKVKTVRITLCTFRTATSSPNARPTEFILKRFPTTTSAKATAQKRANRAGATPLFGSQSAQKFCPGRSRPLLHSGAHVFSPRAKQPRSWPSNSQVPVKWASPPLLHRNLTCYFTLDRARHYGNQSDESSRRTKLCAAQNAPEAGATPPFDAPCVTAPGVAPASG